MTKPALVAPRICSYTGGLCNIVRKNVPTTTKTTTQSRALLQFENSRLCDYVSRALLSSLDSNVIDGDCGHEDDHMMYDTDPPHHL